MRVRLTVPKELVSEDTLNPALEASAQVAQKQIEAGLVPPLADAIDDGLRWAPEPEGQGFEGFDLPTECIDRGWLDCDDIAPWWAAELRASGVDPDAKPIVYQSGPKRWHAVVERGDGSVDDPSRWAGMGKPGSPLPVTRPLAKDGTASIAFKSKRGGTKARIDVPIQGFGDHVGLALEAYGDGAFDALGRGASGALGILGFWGAPDETLLRMHAITHILSGHTEEEFAAMHGCDGYAPCGPFVQGLADRIGAMHATTTFNPGMASDIAMTVLDPLGIHNLVAPLASDFVKSYATGLAHRGEDDAPPKKATKIPDATTSGDDDPCPRGWHWENRGGVNVCVPDRSVNGDDTVMVTLKATGEKIQVPKDYVKKLRDADLIVGMTMTLPFGLPFFSVKQGPPKKIKKPRGHISGDDTVMVTLKATGEKIQVPKDYVKKLRDADLIVGGPRGSGSRGGGRGAGSRDGGSGRGGRGGGSRQQPPDPYGGGYDTDPNTGLPIYYNTMQQEGGYDPFASQFQEYGPPPGYGVPSGWTPQPYSYPTFTPQMAPSMFPGTIPGGAGYYNPFGATLPGTDIAPDAWGGYATPTAFSQYVDQYEKGIRHSAFDDAPLLGQTTTEDR
jgi:putative transposon-encoded protein